MGVLNNACATGTISAMRATHNGNEFTDRWNSETREIFTIFFSPASATLLAANKPLIHFPETRNNFRLFSRKYCRYDRNETLILSSIYEEIKIVTYVRRSWTENTGGYDLVSIRDTQKSASFFSPFSLAKDFLKARTFHSKKKRMKKERTPLEKREKERLITSGY